MYGWRELLEGLEPKSYLPTEHNVTSQVGIPYILACTPVVYEETVTYFSSFNSIRFSDSLQRFPHILKEETRLTVTLPNVTKSAIV